MALLKRSGSQIKIFNLSDYFLPSDKEIQRLIYHLSEDSKKVLHLVSNEILTILNRKVLGQEYKLKVGDLVYVVEFLKAKNPHSLLHSLARITMVLEGGRNYQLRLLNNKIITRHLFSLVPTNANANHFSSQTLDLFCLPTVEETIVPTMTKSKFDAYLDDLKITGNENPSPNIKQHLPVMSDVEQNSRFVLSRRRGVRDNVLSRVSDLVDPVPVLVPVQAQTDDPATLDPEEEVYIKKLQRKTDEDPVVRPKEVGTNLSLPAVKYNKAKMKKSVEKVKTHPAKKNVNNEENYSPNQKYNIPRHEVLAKKLRTREVPGISPRLNVIKEISESARNDIENEPFHVDNNTIAKLQHDLNKVKLVLKHDPTTKKWVSYDKIQKFPEIIEDEEL